MDNQSPRRALILAGGGLKVAFQGGVLQVLLDEARDLRFEHVDAASGGCLNLAMLCQGLSGQRIADNWRQLRPLRLAQPNLGLGRGESIARLERLAESIFPSWGLDFTAIRESPISATFNVYNYSRHRLEVLDPADMTPEVLLACVALPMWFPPVRRAGEIIFDSVYATDANLEEAILRGADDLWVVWTVSRRARWRRGFVHHYFQTIESVANVQFRLVRERIEASNRALALGRHSEFDRPITVRTLYAEVPLHYLINLSSIRFREAVDRGVQAGRDWCREAGIELTQPVTAAECAASSVRFSEVMTGPVGLGATDPARGEGVGREEGASITLGLTVTIVDLDAFLADPMRRAQASGWVESAVLGGRQAVQDGALNLIDSNADSGEREMRYWLQFRTASGHALTLTGVKYLHDDPGVGDIWRDATTLDVQLLAGFVRTGGSGTVIGAGIVRITPFAFARQLTTFRGRGPGLLGDARAVARFQWDFIGRLTQPSRASSSIAPGQSVGSRPVDTTRWRAVAESNGVVLRTHGDGEPLYVIPGMEGSGESCLRLVVGALAAGPKGAARPVLVDYSGEQHASIEALADTIGTLVEADGGTANGIRLWCQSVGTVIGASMLQQTSWRPHRLVLVSAFRSLPSWKVSLTPLALRVTPDVLYRASLRPVGAWQFGPVGGNTDHEFFAALGRLTKVDFIRRLSWLRGRSFEAQFRDLRFQRGSVWLGSRDRLEDVRAETAFFRELSATGGPEVGILDGAGHVVLPVPVIGQSIGQIGRWLWEL